MEKEKTRTRLRELQKSLREAAGNAEKDAESLVKDTRVAFEDVKDNLRRLFRRS